MTSGFPLSPIEFPEQKPHPERPLDIVEAISELSRFPIYRAFTLITEVSADYSISAEEDRVVLVDASSAAVTITLPPAANADAAPYHIKAIDVSGGAVTIDGDSSETIDGATTVTLNVQYQNLTVISDGTEWWIL